MPETWTVLTTLPDHAAADRLGEALENLSPTGVGVLEVDERSHLFEVAGYFMERPDDVSLALLAAAHGAAPFVVSRAPERDWVAQVRRELTPVVAGRFFVHGGHDAHRLPPAAIGLRIEAAMAFGTGHHETTLGCLMAIDRLGRSGARPRAVLDVGCGTGVLAMAAAALWRVPAMASDIDSTATAAALENARFNRLTPWVRVLTTPGLKNREIRRGGPYDLILANILAAPLKRLAPDIARAARPGGVIVLSGLLNRQAPGAARVYAGWGCEVIDRIRLREWTTLVLRRSK